MDVAFVVFDDMTALDFVGAHDPIARLDGYLDLDADVCARAERVTSGKGLTFVADRVDPDLGAYDMVVVPGGLGTRELRADEGFLDWLRGAAGCEWIVSVCTGSLLLGAAGVLDGRTATTHPDAVDLLAEYCEVSAERVVEDGGVITARGVSASIDCGLYVVERLTDADTRREIATAMDYPYGDSCNHR